MHRAHSKYNLIRISTLLLAVLVQASCNYINKSKSKGRALPNIENNWNGPRIFSIGRNGVLTFDGESDLSIPIEGMDLGASSNYQIDATVTGTVPINLSNTDNKNADAFLEFGSIDVMSLRIRKSYLQRAETGDTLDVAIHIQKIDTLRRLQQLATSDQKLDLRQVPQLIASLKDLGSRSAAYDSYGEAKMKTDELTSRLSKIWSEYSILIAESSNQDAKITDLSRRVEESRDEVKKNYSNFLLLAKDIGLPLESIPQPNSEFALNFERRLDLQRYSIEKIYSSGESSRQSPLEKTSLSASFDKLKKSIDNLESKSSQLKAAEDSYNKEQYKISILRSENDIKATMLELVPLIKALDEKRKESNLNAGLVVSTASRTFTLYKTEDYRTQFKGKRVMPSDIMAFPLPEAEVEKFFGKKVADHYFVVRLSVRNTEQDDRLISTGMIRAKGRALVETVKEPRVRFTVPVEVAPHSAVQLYTMLDDEGVNEPRAVFFRYLEFAGAMATGYTGFFGANKTITDSVQLGTGIMDPALQKLIPDRMPGYKRNIVNFSMPDLLKVAGGGVTDHKFLFFPKKKIEGLIIDQNSYGDRDSSRFAAFKGRLTKKTGSSGFDSPHSFVSYLVFDNIEIPFEEVFMPTSSQPKIKVLELIERARTLAQKIKAIQENWDPSKSDSYKLFGEISASDISENPGSLLERLKLNRTLWIETAKSPDNEKLVESAIQNLSTLIEICGYLSPRDGGIKAVSLESNFGLPGVQSSLPDLEAINIALIEGKTSERFSSRLDEIESRLKTAQAALMFAEESAAILGDKSLRTGLPKSTSDDFSSLLYAPPTTSDQIQSRIESFRSLNTRLHRLETLRGLELKPIILPDVQF